MALCMLVALWGQTTPRTRITGTVRDARDKSPLPGANVVLTGGRLKTTTGAATDLDGYYVIPNLPPGTYRIKVSYIGYRDYEQNVEVTAETGPRIEIHVELEWEAIRLQEYVITASRGKREKLTDAPAAMSVITSSEIRRGSNPNLGDYFKHVKGVDFTASGIDGFNLSARGFNTSFSSRLLTLTDGRKANVPSLRLIAYNTIPTTSDDVDQIEVVLGPSSALYGPNAYSGVANIITKKPRVSTGTTAGLSIGNRDYLKLQARHAGVLGKLGYKISLVNFRATDWRWVDPEEAKGHHKFWIEDDGEIDQAMADFDEAIRLDPDEPRYYQHRCLVWFQLDNTQQALADITKAIDVQPDYAEAYELRGIILGNDGQYEKAFHNFDKAASLDPARSASLSKKKQMLMETRDRK